MEGNRMRCEVLLLPPIDGAPTCNVVREHDSSQNPIRLRVANQEFEFDRVFDQDDDPASVANECLGDLVNDCAAGCNACIFVSGEADDEEVKQPFAHATAIAAAAQLFGIIDEARNTFPDDPTTWNVRVSMYTVGAEESTGETITDALAAAAGLGAAGGADGGPFSPGGRLASAIPDAREGSNGGILLSPKSSSGPRQVYVPVSGADGGEGGEAQAGGYGEGFGTASYVAMQAGLGTVHGRMTGSSVDYDRTGTNKAERTRAASAAASIAASGLQLRDDPTFGAATVPGLWEVECEGPRDVADLLASVPLIGHGGRRVHSIVLLTLHCKRPHTHMHATTGGIVEDMVDSFSRMSVVRLARASGSSTASAVKKDGSSAPAKRSIPGWVLSLSSVLTAVEQRAPVVPFAASKATTLLRDALIGRVPSVFVALVPNQPSVGLATLQFATRVRSAAGTLSSAIATARATSSAQGGGQGGMVSPSKVFAPTATLVGSADAPPSKASPGTHRTIISGPEEYPTLPPSHAHAHAHGHGQEGKAGGGDASSAKSVEAAASAALQRYAARQRARAAEAHGATSAANAERDAAEAIAPLVTLLPTSPYKDQAGAGSEETGSAGFPASSQYATAPAYGTSMGNHSSLSLNHSHGVLKKSVSFNESVRVDLYTPPDPQYYKGVHGGEGEDEDEEGTPYRYRGYDGEEEDEEDEEEEEEHVEQVEMDMRGLSHEDMASVTAAMHGGQAGMGDRALNMEQLLSASAAPYQAPSTLSSSSFSYGASASLPADIAPYAHIPMTTEPARDRVSSGMGQGTGVGAGAGAMPPSPRSPPQPAASTTSTATGAPAPSPPFPLASPTGRTGIDLAAVSADLATTSRALFASTLTALQQSRTEVASLKAQVADLARAHEKAVGELAARREADEQGRAELAAGLDEAATFAGQRNGTQGGASMRGGSSSSSSIGMVGMSSAGPRQTATSRARASLGGSKRGNGSSSSAGAMAMGVTHLGPSSVPNPGSGMSGRDMTPLPDPSDPEVDELRQVIVRLQVEKASLAKRGRDFELYREVVEASITRLQKDVQRVAAERDTAQKAARTSAAAASRDRQALGHARRRIAELEALVNALEEQSQGKEAAARAVTQLRSALREARALSANAEESYGVLREEAGEEVSALRAALAEAQQAAAREHMRAQELSAEVDWARAKLARGSTGSDEPSGFSSAPASAQASPASLLLPSTLSAPSPATPQLDASAVQDARQKLSFSGLGPVASRSSTSSGIYVMKASTGSTSSSSGLVPGASSSARAGGAGGGAGYSKGRNASPAPSRPGASAGGEPTSYRPPALPSSTTQPQPLGPRARARAFSADSATDDATLMSAAHALYAEIGNAVGGAGVGGRGRASYATGSLQLQPASPPRAPTPSRGPASSGTARAPGGMGLQGGVAARGMPAGRGRGPTPMKGR